MTFSVTQTNLFVRSHIQRVWWLGEKTSHVARWILISRLIDPRIASNSVSVLTIHTFRRHICYNNHQIELSVCLESSKLNFFHKRNDMMAYQNPLMQICSFAPFERANERTNETSEMNAPHQIISLLFNFANWLAPKLASLKSWYCASSHCAFTFNWLIICFVVLGLGEQWGSRNILRRSNLASSNQTLDKLVRPAVNNNGIINSQAPSNIRELGSLLLQVGEHTYKEANQLVVAFDQLC